MMKSDSEIARSHKLRTIKEIAGTLRIPQKHLILFGSHIAKIHSNYLQELKRKPDGKLILVTSMSPTPSGEGKTTLTIGMAQAFKQLRKKIMACIRQPSLGPLFGVKGGATGSGYAQVFPVEDITLHFTGDDHAVAIAHNLISSFIDNHLYHGNRLGIDVDRILWKRVSGLNDRALRKVRVGLDKKGIERAEEFYISAASEIMSILCLSQNIEDLKNRVGDIHVAYNKSGNAIFVRDLNIQGAVTAVLKNALNPNLVQSLEGVPVFVHGGPFGNVSLGASSLIATKTALKLSDYVITEAGFATELGAEKFFNIKCRVGDIKPSAVIIVATLKALRLHGGAKDYEKEDMDAALKGVDNLEKHSENIRKFGLPFLVAINRFASDSEEELSKIMSGLRSKSIPAYVADVRNKGGKGGADIAKEVIRLCKQKNSFHHLYPLDLPIQEKIGILAQEMYGAGRVVFTGEAEKDIKDINGSGYQNLPVCIAKTPRSLSDNASLFGRPKDFSITVNRILPAAGAGFLVALCGNILLMPGLPEHPIAERIDVDKKGNITGLE